MGASQHIRRLRALVGHELLLLPSVAVLPQDADGRVLLVRHADSGSWGTIGGAVEIDEDPQDAARREAREEAGVEVALQETLATLGGPEFRITYPNGDESAYVTTVFGATIVSGKPRPDGNEVLDVAWIAQRDLAALDMEPFAQATLRGVGLFEAR